MCIRDSPNCDTAHNIFGHDGAKAEAEKLGVPFLGAAPLNMDIRQSADAGQPIALGDGAMAEIFAEIAQGVIKR